ncbi:MAG: hypothetical protein C4293_11525 [Nitrospiraceae bacterium]
MNIHKRFLMLGMAVFIAAGCATTPQVTRTGQVKDVMIRENVSPSSMTVKPGDEIRWINRRTGPVRIIFLQPVEDKISCQRGFSGIREAVGMGNASTTTLDANESASLCFSKPGEFRYTVRMQADAPGGEINEPGTIRVQETGS